MDWKKIIEKVQEELFVQILSYSGIILHIWDFFYFSQNIETAMENRRVSLNRNHISI